VIAPRRAAALLAAGVALLGFACQPAESPSDAETRGLARALGGVRVTEARLTGFDEWTAWTGGTALSDSSKAAVYQSAAAIQQRKALSDDPGWYASLGVRHLLIGEWPRAIALLESSRAMAGDRASRLNDLAAACFAQASATKDAERLAYALDLAEAAARANPALLTARFNRALILESIGPASRAAEAWSDYLRADASSGWAREASAHRDRLTAIVRQMRPDPLNRHAVEGHLLTWAQAVVHGDQAAAAVALTAADAAAVKIRTRNSDSYPAGLVADARRHERLGRAKPFALAYVDGNEGRSLIQQSNDLAGGGSRIDRAITLTSPGGAFADFLEYWRLHVGFYQRIPRLEQSLRELTIRSKRNGSGYVAARSEVLLGSVLQRLARYSDAIESYQHGIDDYGRIGEQDSAATACMLVAAALREHGMWQDAWRFESMALSGFDGLTNDSQRHLVLHEATRLALARRQTDLAARFQGFLAAHAREWNDPGALTAAAVTATRIALQRGLPQEASAELGHAEATRSRIPDKAFRDSYYLELLTLKTEVQTHVAPAQALESARALVEAADREKVLYRRVRAHWLLGKAAMAAGQTAAAAAAWQSGIAALEDENLSARDEQLRIARTSDVWAIYDDLIRLLVNQRKPEDALAAAERGRARVLLSTLAPSPRPLAIDASLGAGATILYYTLLRDRTLIWVLDGREIRLTDVAGGVELATALSNELRAVAASQGDPSSVLQRLYGALISPIAGSLPAGRRVIVVPDGLLSSVPFAALQSPATGRLMVEDHELQMAPSLTLLRLALERPDSGPAPRRVFAVGSPAASAALPPLPGARREVEQISALYGKNQPALPDQYSVTAFLDNVRRSDVVHFAGHAVEDRDFPDRSYLAMPGSARLTAAEIQKSDFGRVRLLVLSACSTAEGAVERGEGVLSLTRPFLAAGVEQVLATVSAVDDGVAPLLVEFHTEMRAGATPAAALRAVQRHAYKREGKVSLRGWAAFELFGVVASR
jgi:CHAT domain-containing protein/tetratricopeptide (TPR) repeat protein